MTTVHEYPEFVASRAKQLPSFEERIDHALLGVITECGELADAWKKHTIYERPLDTVNVREELGDLRFYLQMLLNEKIEIDATVLADAFIARESGERVIEFLPLVGEIISTTSGGVFHAKLGAYRTAEGRKTAAVLLTRAMGGFQDLCAFFHYDETEIIAENIVKLETRYPIGYTNEHAAARLDKLSSEEK
jgi:NTP pyrophosphatase (non-canonical NTP hydrolase)